MLQLKLHKNVEDLYDHIPPKYLPEDYGGQLPTFSEIHGKL